MRAIAIAALAFTIAVLAGGAHGATPLLLSASQPSWSPDGTQIALSGAVPGTGRSDVYIIARTGGPPANLTVTDDEPNHLFPAWSPGGAYVASGSELGGPTTNHEVYSVTTVLDHVTKHVATSSAIGPISWSHDAHWLAIDDRESALLARADGSAQHPVASPGCCGVWSKRTLRLAVSIEHTSGFGGTDIYLVNAAGHVSKRLTKPPKHRLKGAPLAIDNTALAWSRDGSRLLFWSTRARTPGLYVTRADGTHQVRVAAGRVGDISPRGTAVVYSGKGIWIVGAAGNHRHRISPNGTQPRWSPDGQWLAYTVRRANGVTGIDIVRPDGTQRHALAGG